MKTKQSIIYIFLIFIGFTYISRAQITENHHQMIWTSFSLNKKISNKFNVNYFQLHSIDLNSSKLNFIQSKFSFNFKLQKHLNFSLGYSPTFSLDGVAGNQLVYHRVSARLRIKTKLPVHLYMKNSIVGEYHFTQRSKWQERYYYRLDLEYRNKHHMPWKMRPFISQKFYWYRNGRLLQYYDAGGNKTDLRSPNGLHAYRFQAGIKVYPIKKWHFTFYYLKQKEFNSSLFGSKEINSLNPNSGKIRRAFYDFAVLGFTLSHKL